MCAETVETFHAGLLDISELARAVALGMHGEKLAASEFLRVKELSAQFLVVEPFEAAIGKFEKVAAVFCEIRAAHEGRLHAFRVIFVIHRHGVIARIAYRRHIAGDEQHSKAPVRGTTTVPAGKPADEAPYCPRCPRS